VQPLFVGAGVGCSQWVGCHTYAMVNPGGQCWPVESGVEGSYAEILDVCHHIMDGALVVRGIYLNIRWVYAFWSGLVGDHLFVAKDNDFHCVRGLMLMVAAVISMSWHRFKLIGSMLDCFCMSLALQVAQVWCRLCMWLHV